MQIDSGAGVAGGCGDISKRWARDIEAEVREGTQAVQRLPRDGVVEAGTCIDQRPGACLRCRMRRLGVRYSDLDAQRGNTNGGRFTDTAAQHG